MSIVSAIAQEVSKRGGTMIIRIKQDLRAAGKDATGRLINETKGDTTVNGNVVLFEGKAPGHYEFVDKGRRAGATPPPIKAINAWIKQKGLDLNAYAVAKSIGEKGIKATNIYSDNVEKFIKDMDLTEGVRSEIIKDIKQ
tara:strand:- start:135 stop:554 length:420 start_codon:yes stop_codon:yes gene_type:complete